MAFMVCSLVPMLGQAETKAARSDIVSSR